MKAISDATALIHLSRIGKIHYLKKLFESVIIPVEVYEEVVIKGKALGKKDTVLIENLVSENFIQVKKASSRSEMRGLHLGEIRAIALCSKLKVKTLIIDEKEGYEAAKLMGLNPLRTTALLLKLLVKKIINFAEYKESLLALSE